jgi:outer membrane lipopolysaccharide assembly protein LptE/RlpB
VKLLGLTAATLVCGLAGCGYHMAGHSDLIPQSVHTIAIPAFGNVTTRYKLTDWLPEAIAREFIASTRYRVVSDPDQADAVLHGAVVNYFSYPTIFDTQTGRATGVDIRVTLQVSLVERATGKVLFNRPAFEVRDRYEISTNPQQYFEESETALNRASDLVARRVVSDIVNNF